MSKKTLYLLGILLTILIGTWLYYKYCCACNKNASTTINAATVANPFNIAGNDFNFQCNDNFKFALNSPEIVTPVSDSIHLGIDKLKTFLDANPNKNLNLAGYFLSSEKNNTTFENLGIARAEAIKEFLIDKGIPAERITTSGEQKDNVLVKDNVVMGPLGISLAEPNAKTNTRADSTSTAKALDVKPLILHFSPAQSSIQLSSDDKKTIEDIKAYLTQNSNAKVVATGYSDNTGNLEMNINLSKQRAEFGKTKLAALGIDETKIETIGKGPENPIADNATSEGRAENRRVEITVQ